MNSKPLIAPMLEISWKGRPPFRAQIMRLASTQYFPALDEGVKELIDTLIRVSGGNQDHARRIIDRALQESRTCPTPMDLESAASTVPRHESAPSGCWSCEGTGRRYVQICGYDCQAHCDCPLGQFLKDGEHRPEDANAQSTERKPATAALEQARSRDKQHGPNKKRLTA